MQVYDCLPPRGDRHTFTGPLEPGNAERSVTRRQVCSDPHHLGSKVVSRGQRETPTGTWARFTCTPAAGDRHSFQVLVTPSGKAVMALHQPPECPRHPAGRVSRWGKYGRGTRKRQLYRCVPPEGAPHTFAPPLSREVVDVGHDVCDRCDELLSPHNGALTGSRHTPWTLQGVVRGLDSLSQGTSYASVSRSMAAYRDQMHTHLAEAHGVGEAPQVDGKRASWRVAANLVEQYAPLVWAKVEAAMVARERLQREDNDVVLAAGGTLPHPLTYVLDAQHVELTHRSRSPRTAGQLGAWYVLTAIELRWSDGPSGPVSTPRLRLARAYPGNTELAWRLALDELPVKPDVVVSDAGAGLLNAVRSKWDCLLVPSLFHVHRNVRAILYEITTGKSGYKTKALPRGVRLPGDLDKLLTALRRDELLQTDAGTWSAWWDTLVGAVAALGAPTSRLASLRQTYEPLVGDALPTLHAMPQLPASNAAVEALIRHRLEPFLGPRGPMYRNAARTNFLLDLAVCRDQDAFVDLDALGRLVRGDNERYGGWAPALRTLDDRQPPARHDGSAGPLYSSLLSPQLVSALAEKRGTDPGATS